MRVHVHVRTRVCVCVCAHAHVHVCTRVRTCTSPAVPTTAPSGMRMHVHVRACMCMYVYAHAALEHALARLAEDAPLVTKPLFDEVVVVVRRGRDDVSACDVRRHLPPRRSRLYVFNQEHMLLTYLLTYLLPLTSYLPPRRGRLCVFDQQQVARVGHPTCR